MRSLEIAGNPHLRFLGPSLECGPLPAVLYLALSANDSLEMVPINQPATFLPLDKIRVFSVTLPGHGPGLDNARAMHYWVQHLNSGENIFEDFFDSTAATCRHLISEGLIEDENFFVAGLSRGGFLAFHLLIRCPELKGLCVFSPVTDLAVLNEFSNTPWPDRYRIDHHLNALIDKPMFISIGNKDTRVGTESCMRLTESLIQKSIATTHRPPAIELSLFPSVGHKGHGTPPERFAAGSHWMLNRLTH